MVNIKEKAREAFLAVERKALPVVCSAAIAVSSLTVNALAADDDSTMYQAVADQFSSSVKELGLGVTLILQAVLPIGISIIGLYTCVGAGKRIMTKLIGS